MGQRSFNSTTAGGVVIYPFKEEQGPMLSSFRKDALDLMKENMYAAAPTALFAREKPKGALES